MLTKPVIYPIILLGNGRKMICTLSRNNFQYLLEDDEIISYEDNYIRI